MTNAELVATHLAGHAMPSNDRADAVRLIVLSVRHGVCPFDSKVMTPIFENGSHARFVCVCGYHAKV